MDLHEIQGQLVVLLNEASHAFHKVPGSAVLIRYVQASYQNDPIRSIFELFLLIFFIRYLLSPSYATNDSNYVKLSEDEIEELVEDWQPEPLVAKQTPLEEMELERLPVIAGPTGPKSKLVNGRTVINLASYNIYNLNSNEQIKEKAITTLRTYGVGPCGPPNFYGTQDVHMKTETDVAAYLGTESCILYAQGFSVISSVLPAFCKRGDVIVADRAANYSIRKGIELARCSVKWYTPGDVEELEEVMNQVAQEQVKQKKLTRRFLVAEGLSETTGGSIDLPRMIELKEKYKFRMILDESWSFGVLGRTGRGVTEAQNVDPSQVDMIIGNLSGPLCAGGGFCAGSKDVVGHQRISSSAYCFSAALPAMLAVTASETISLLQTNPEILTNARENTRALRAQLDPRSDWVMCTSALENPILLLVFKPNIVQSRRMSFEEQDRVLQDCVDEALANGVMITRLRTTLINKSVGGGQMQPALKICATTGLSKKEIEKAGITIRHAITKVMTRKTSSKLALPTA
ncbi:serine palmitoyltransferase component [Gnomoniopsis sp. IMI 355080]|nr:serine palmitoyltransferase component [Gnomoniopsis sp. IMI 355080]